jgi:phenylacetate-CoA ligase
MIKKYLYDIFLKISRKDFEVQYNSIELSNYKKYLENLLLHSYVNVPYYSKIFQNINLINNKINMYKFYNLPILTKDIIRKHYTELISKDYMKRKWYYNSSGGSTGEPVRFIQDELYKKWSNATNKYYYHNMLGIDEMHCKKVILWGSERDIFEGTIGLRAKISNWLTNTIFLNSFRMTKEDMEKYVKIINQYKPELIRGYASSLYELCKFAEMNDLKIFTPKVLVSAAETLNDYMREKIESVFGTKVYNFYGSREVNGIAGECREGSMHIFIFSNYVEILDYHNLPVTEGREGKIIVTNLHNYSMPLIRYEIGDTGILESRRCKCGNQLPILKKITGRITDHFIKKDGTIIHGEYFTHLFYLKDWIKTFRVIQEDYDKIRILAVPQGKINEIEKKDIENKIKLVMGKDCKIYWEFLEEISKPKSGKHLYTQSLLYER